MYYCIDNGFTQSDFIPQWGFNALHRRYSSGNFVFNIQFCQHAFGRFNKRTISVLIILYQITTVKT